MGKCVFIVNPSSSSWRTSRRIEELRPAISTLFSDAQIVLTKQRGHATQLAREAIKRGTALIVSMGGDGTLNEVANGFFENGRNISNGCALAILMSGTGGDFRRSLDWPKDQYEQLLKIKAGKTAVVDVGVVHCTNAGGMTSPRYFMNAASVGFSALVARKVSDSHGSKNQLSYVAAALSSFGEYVSAKILASFDDGERMFSNLLLLAFANGAYFGAGMHIAPGAKVDDGVGEIIAISNLSRSYALLNLPKIYRGTHLSLARVDAFKAKRLTLSNLSESEVLIETDGEPCGMLPAKFEIMKDAITLVR